MAKVICPYCGTGCSVELEINENVISKVSGQKLSPVNSGKLCVKGQFGWDYVNHPDRLNTPYIRKKDGKFDKNGKLEPSSWEEAFDLVASKFQKIKQTYGSDAISGNFSTRCTLEENYLAQKFIRVAIGTNNVDHCARVWHAPTVAGLAKTIGSGTATNSFTEISEHSKCVMIIGSNPENAHPIAAGYIQKAQKNGAKIISINPICTKFSQKADFFIPVPTEYNIPLLNAMLNVIIERNLVDEEFIKNHTFGFEYVKKNVENYDVYKVAKELNLDPNLIIDAAITYATNKPAAIIHGMGVTHFNHGTANVCAISNLFLATKNIGVAGSGNYPLRGQQNVQGSSDLGVLPNVFPNLASSTDKNAISYFEKFWDCKLSQNGGIFKSELPKHIDSGKIKMLYTIGENPVMSETNTNHFLKSLKKLDFFVVQDIFLSETALKADVVLPAVTVAEKVGCYTNTERRVQLSIGNVEPLKGAKQDWQIICELAKRLGFEKQFSYENPEEIWEEIRQMDKARFGGMSYKRLLQEHGLCWPCPDEKSSHTPILYKDFKFKTEDFKANFSVIGFCENGDEISNLQEKTKLELGLPERVPCLFGSPSDKPNDEYPFVLITGRKQSQYTVGTMTRKSPKLNDKLDSDGAELKINPKAAQRLNLQSGDAVKIESKQGFIACKILVDDMCVQENAVFMECHYKEALVNELTSDVMDQITKTPSYKAAVKISKISLQEMEKIQEDKLRVYDCDGFC